MQLAPLLLVGLIAGPLLAVEPVSSPMIRHDFEKDESGWLAFGSPSAHLHLTHEPGFVKNGTASLEFDYDATAGKPALAVLRTPHGLAGARSFGVWMMADAPTAEAMVLTEKGGARYAAIFWLEPKTWQRVELTPEDYILGRSPGDPEDADGRLDLDQVEALSLVDLSQILNERAGEGDAPIAVIAHTGPQKIFLDDFEVSAAAPDWYKPRPAFTIDTFDHPQIDWFTLGGADLRREAASRVMKVDYEQLTDRYVVFIRQLPALDLRGATHLEFDIASDKAAQFVVSFEERVPGANNGPRYSAVIRVSGGGTMEHRRVALSGFEFDANGPKDANGKLDLDQLKSLTFVDITGASTQESAVNSIRLANVQAVKTTALPQ